MTTSQNQIEQNNTYAIYNSMGKHTGLYVIASNIKQACKLAQPIAFANKLGSFYKVKRAYSGGVRG